VSPQEAITVLRAWSKIKKIGVNSKSGVMTTLKEYQIADEICEELGRLPLTLRLAGQYMLGWGEKIPSNF